jgi:hypothetical protein
MQYLEERAKTNIKDCIEEWGEWDTLDFLLEECEYVLSKIVDEYERNKYTRRCDRFIAEIANFRKAVFDDKGGQQ